MLDQTWSSRNTILYLSWAITGDCPYVSHPEILRFARKDMFNVRRLLRKELRSSQRRL